MMNYRHGFTRRRGGFTLIELIVVITILGLLVTLGASSYQNVVVSSRDTKRKADLKEIKTALDRYYATNGRFPQAGTCAYGTNCYVYSTAGDSWIPALVSTYMDKIPLDPTNNAAGPWSATANNYSYAYGNVLADGQGYDLTTRLENTSDPERCGVKDYRFYYDNRHWCVAFPPGAYSNQIYEVSPLSPPGALPLTYLQRFLSFLN